MLPLELSKRFLILHGQLNRVDTLFREHADSDFLLLEIDNIIAELKSISRDVLKSRQFGFFYHVERGCVK